jgi:hypothetical protein
MPIVLPQSSGMELNDQITISNEYQFCEEGNRLALVFMKASRDSVAMLCTESVTDAQTRVDTTLSALRWHVANCPDCNED